MTQLSAFRAVTLAALAVLSIACASLQTGLASVRDRSLYYSCGGSGPSVVFLAGLGGDHSLWPIAERIRGQARACTYDRVGDGTSSRPAEKSSAAEDVVDLHELIGVTGMGLSRPVVLVGHSYGGLLAYYAARKYPFDVAGLVLIDGSHPRQEDEFHALMTDDQWSALQEDDDNRPYADFSASLADVAADYGPLGGLPLTVITANDGFADDECSAAGLPCAQMQATWLDLQDEYASLSSASRHVEADTGHYIHDERPELVIEEILTLLNSLGEAGS